MNSISYVKHGCQRKILKVKGYSLSSMLSHWNGNSPLGLAIRRGYESLAQLFVVHGADTSIKDDSFRTAVIEEDLRTLDNLIANEYDVNTRDSLGYTSLHIACKNMSIASIAKLLEAGADTSIVNQDNFTPLEMFLISWKVLCGMEASEKNIRMLKILLEAGGNIEDMANLGEIEEDLYTMKNVCYVYTNNSTEGMDPHDLLNSQENEKKIQVESLILMRPSEEQICCLCNVLENSRVKAFVACNIDMDSLSKVIENTKVADRLVTFNVSNFNWRQLRQCIEPTLTVLCIMVVQPIPKEIELDAHIRILNLSHCKQKYPVVTKSSLAKYISINCKAIDRLFLNNNNLKKIQGDIADVNRLSILDVHGNALARIPSQIATPGKLRRLLVHGNPVVNIPKDIIQDGSDAVLSYLGEFLHTDTVPNNGVKMMLVGHAGAGKSTLVRALSGKVTGVDKTDGIEISEISVSSRKSFLEKFRKQKREVINIKCFDFAGDIDYLETHALFITDHTLVLLVFDMSECTFNRRYFEGAYSAQLERILLWLKTIGSQGPNSHVILVGTHADSDRLNTSMLDDIWCQLRKILNNVRHSHSICNMGNLISNCMLCQPAMFTSRSTIKGVAGQVKIDSTKNISASDSTEAEASLVDEIFPHIVGYYEVSSVSCFRHTYRGKNKSLDQLKDAIENEATNLVSLQPQIPESWNMFRNSLASYCKQLLVGDLNFSHSNRQPVITCSLYRELAAGYHLYGESLQNVTSFLRSQGNILYYKRSKSSSAKDLIILEPQWLANQLKILVSYKADYISPEGFLYPDDLIKALGHVLPEHRRALVDLFIAIGVCFPETDYVPEEKDRETCVPLTSCDAKDPDSFSKTTSQITILSKDSEKLVASEQRLPKAERHPSGCDEGFELKIQPLLFPCKLPVGQPSDKDWPQYPKEDEKQLTKLFEIKCIPVSFFCDVIVEINRHKLVFDSKPKFYSNNVLYVTHKVWRPCMKCPDALCERGSDNMIDLKVPHIVKIQLDFRNSNIEVSIRGRQPCCFMHNVEDLLNSVCQMGKYPGTTFTTSILCPLCVVESHKPPGKFNDNVRSQLVCAECYHHRFNDQRELFGGYYSGKDKHVTIGQIAKAIENTDCPRLFVILPINIGILPLYAQAFTFVRDCYAVHLLCECPGEWHFLDCPGYPIYRVKEFVKKYGPHVAKVLKAVSYLQTPLSLVGSHAGPVYGSGLKALGGIANASGKVHDILSDFLSDFSKQYPELNKYVQGSTDFEDLKLSATGIQRRELSRFLRKADEDRRFGDLYPVSTDNDILWLCKEHFKYFR